VAEQRVAEQRVVRSRKKNHFWIAATPSMRSCY
jgi:hypothetical protein